LKKRCILKSNILLFLVLLIVGCKPYYDSSKIYFTEKNELLNKSKKVDLKFPLKVDFDGNININGRIHKLKGFIKLENDKHFQLFLFSKTFGVELCRIDINGTKIIFIDKINKEYFKAPIQNFKYLGNSNLISNNIFQLIFGRVFQGVTLYNMDGFNDFNYSANEFKGNLSLYNFGFVKTHKFSSDVVNFDLLYENYSVSNNIPTILTGEINLKDIKIDLLMNFVINRNQDLILDDLIIPDNYKEIL